MGEKLTKIIDWIDFAVRRGIRRARCELSGGHKNNVAGSWLFAAESIDRRATHVKLYCERCRTATRWYDVPTLNGNALADIAEPENAGEREQA